MRKKRKVGNERIVESVVFLTGYPLLHAADIQQAHKWNLI